MNQTLQNSYELMYHMLDTFTIDQIKEFLKQKLKYKEPSMAIKKQINTIRKDMKNRKM
jgi:hypothetical protein